MTGTARGTLVSCLFYVIMGIKQTGSYPKTCLAKEALGLVNPNGSPSRLVYGPGEKKWPGRPVECHLTRLKSFSEDLYLPLHALAKVARLYANSKATPRSANTEIYQRKVKFLYFLRFIFFR